MSGTSATRRSPGAVSLGTAIFTARMIRSGMTPRQACLACLAEPLSDDPQTVAALMDVVDVHFA